MTLVLRGTKGSRLTTAEMDANLSGLADGSLLTGLAASTGSSLVGFVQSGTAPLSRSAQAKNRDIVDLADFATLDGTTDDAAAINQFFTDLTNADGTTGQGFGGTGTRMPIVWCKAANVKIGSKITFPNGTHLKGAGRWNTRFFAASGFAGIMLQDKGNASKITVEDFQIDANDEAGVTNLLDLGNGATAVWGTGGGARGLLLRGGTSAVNAGTVGLYHQSNVISIIDVHTMYCDTGIEEVAGTNGTFYSDISILGADTYGLKTIGECSIGTLEIEAPTADCIGLYVNRKVSIQHLTYSQASGVTNPYAIEIDASAESFSMNHCVHTVTGGSVLTNLIKDNRASGGFQTNWGARSATERRTMGVMDELHVGSLNAFRLGGMQLTNFRLQITNTAGTLQHKITCVGDTTVASTYAAATNGASATLANTPTGTDGSTAFVSGGKVSSVSAHIFILDTLNHASQQFPVLMAVVVDDDTGDDVRCQPQIINRDVNGVTRKRLELLFNAGATGANWSVNTTNIGAGESVAINILAFLLVTPG